MKFKPWPLVLLLSGIALLAYGEVKDKERFYTPKQDLQGLKVDLNRDADLPNVLLIGDSISIGYTKPVVGLLKGVANVQRAKANCGDTSRGLKALSSWLGDTPWDVIHFNWGLHDLCYRHPDSKVYGKRDKINGAIAVPLGQYEKNLESLVLQLKATGAKLIWGTTTLVPEGEAGRRVGDEVRYNAAAKKTMQKHGVAINDLHALTASFPAKLFTRPGDVHFTAAGSQKLAEQVADAIRQQLPAKKLKPAGGPALHSDSPARPNVVFILVDDLGWNDLGCTGSSFHETPRVDGLAAEGLRFSMAYAASPVCSPTRASILTGKYPARINFWRATPTDELPHAEVTLPEALKESGYRTAHLGKWHLMLHGKKGEGHGPEGHGYDVNVGGHDAGGPGSYFFPYTRKGNDKNDVPHMEDGKEGDYLTDALTEKAIAFMDETQDQPFFLSMWYYAVHTPVQGKAAKIAKYEQKAEALGLAEGAILEGGRYSRKQQDNPTYAAMVESMDENVGRLLDYLKESGRADNTIVIFMSDNGGLSTISSKKGGATSCLPLRGGKAWVYEGGIRVPMIIKWPGVTAQGSVSDTPVVSTDFYPTILEMAGLPLRPEQHLDGVSLAGLLKGEADRLDREALYFHFPQDHHLNSMGPSAAIRVGDYKLVERFSDKSVELFNLKDDEEEQKDLSKAMPEKTEKLRAMLHQWRKDTDAWMPMDKPKREIK